jgi:hypothetical protein
MKRTGPDCHLQIERIYQSIGEHGTSSAGRSTTPWPDRSGLGLDSHCGPREEDVTTVIAVEDVFPYRCMDGQLRKAACMNQLKTIPA